MSNACVGRFLYLGVLCFTISVGVVSEVFIAFWVFHCLAPSVFLENLKGI